AGRGRRRPPALPRGGRAGAHGQRPRRCRRRSRGGSRRPRGDRTAVSGRRAPRLQAAWARRRRDRARRRPRPAADARPPALGLHGQRARVRGAPDRRRRVPAEGGEARTDRRRRPRLRTRRDGRPAGADGRARLGDPDARGARRAGADRPRARDPAADRRGAEPAGDRRPALPRRHDREDARPARLREARRFRPGGRGCGGDAATADRVGTLSLAAAPATELPEAHAEGERRIAWLRLALLPLVVAAHSLPHPNPARTAFFVAVGVVGSYGVVALAWSHLRPISARFSLAATALDVAAITVLVTLSGGAFSQVRLTYFLVPVAVAFRFRPLLTALAGASTVAAYIAQSYAHEAAHEPGADRFILVQAGFLALLALASVLLSAVLERRTARITELAEVRRRLIADSLVAEERQRQALAEALHDSTIQNL